MNTSSLLTLLIVSSTSLLAENEPIILKQVPPADAGRGLIRTSAREIRHYSGHAKQDGALPYIVSKDNGKTWSKEMSGEQFPKKWGGITKEAAAIVFMPKSKKYIMIQPINGYIFMADDIDGPWYSPAASGGAFIQANEWLQDQSKLYQVPKGWIYRNPLELSSGDIIIPMHQATAGTRFLISKNGGKSWKTSKDSITIAPFQEKGIDLGGRWRNSGVEGTAVELKNGQVYALVRTDSNMSYEATSRDGGNTWSKPRPSPFYGSLIMSTLGRLKDGQLICLWTNTAPLPELAHGRTTQWEDVFTARGALHVAFSKDEAKSWYGYREVIIDPLRDSSTFATDPGDHDRSSHQAEFVELDDKRILVSSGQHEKHRKLIIIEKDWVSETSRTENFQKNGLDNISAYTFIPKIHRAQYNRKSGVVQTHGVDGQKDGGVQFGYLNDSSLVSNSPAADYRRSGLTWNFPLAHQGEVSFKVKFPEGSNGCYVSLTDRMFAPCDVTTPQRSIFSLKLAPGERFGNSTLKSETPYEVRLRFKDKKCLVYINKGKKPIASLNAQNPVDVGISYLHFIAAEDKMVDSEKAESNGNSPFYSFIKGGKRLEKSTIVSDFSAKSARK